MSVGTLCHASPLSTAWKRNALAISNCRKRLIFQGAERIQTVPVCVMFTHRSLLIQAGRSHPQRGCSSLSVDSSSLQSLSCWVVSTQSSFMVLDVMGCDTSRLSKEQSKTMPGQVT